MKLHICAGAAAGLAMFAAGAAMAQVTISGDGTEMPDLKACIAAADEADKRAIDACVAANMDEIEAFIAAHPKTEAAMTASEGSGSGVGGGMTSEDTSEGSE